MKQKAKNEKIVHTRVSDELFQKILTKARKNRVTTSNLIRNLVEDYIEIHEDVWEAVDRKIKGYIETADDEIVGYQPFILKVTKKCFSCEAEIKAGEQAYLGVREKSSRRIILCPKCSRSG